MRFKGILLDVPCSGLGVTGRHPDIRWQRRPDDLYRYQQKQLQLLTVGSLLLAPGGILVYGTCSMEPEENDEVVAAFLKDNPGFRHNFITILPIPIRYGSSTTCI